MSLAAFDLNLLLVLETVLAERSVARAARRLHVTPSAVSNALARLRVVLGDPLVARRGRGIVPTPRATELAPTLTRALRDLDDAIHGVTFDPAASTRTFTLALADAGQIVSLPAIARRFGEELPRARLRVVGIDSLVALGDLGGTEVDAAIGIGGKAPGIHLERLFDEPTVLVGRRASHATKLSRASLARLRHVAVEMVPGRGFRDHVGAAYARAGIAREVATTVPTFVAAAAVAAGTDLVATLPRGLADVLASRLGLRVLAGPIPRHTVTMYLSWHDRTHADAGMAHFRALLCASTTAKKKSTPDVEPPHSAPTLRERAESRERSHR